MSKNKANDPVPNDVEAAEISDANEESKQPEISELKKARVLLRIEVNGVVYEPDQIIEVDDALLKSLAGQVDPHPDAVAYCKGNK